MHKYPEPIRPKRPPRLFLYRCVTGHVYFNRHSQCPECGEKLLPAGTIGRGVLLTLTRMAVTPSSEPLQLGIVQWRGGARTLCRIIGAVRGQGNDPVWLIQIDGIYHAFGRSSRRRIPRGDLIRQRG